MFVILYHDEEAFRSPSFCTIYGPFETLDQAKVGLAGLVASVNDPLFKIDPVQDDEDGWRTNDGTLAGFAFSDLFDAGRDVSSCDEIWAKIEEITPPADLSRFGPRTFPVRPRRSD